MNNVLLFLVVPCLLGFLFVQGQYGSGGDEYNRLLAARYLQKQQSTLFGLTTGELFGAILTCYAIWFLTNGTGGLTG